MPKVIIGMKDEALRCDLERAYPGVDFVFDDQNYGIVSVKPYSSNRPKLRVIKGGLSA